MPPINKLQVLRTLVRNNVIQSDGDQFRITIDQADKSGLNLHKHIGRSKLKPGEIVKDLELIEAIKFLRAEKAAEDMWNKLGGPKSPIGLPKTGKITLNKTGNTYTALFRSGKIIIDGKEYKVELDRELEVFFKGLECNIRQEGEDELYGVVSMLGPANKHVSSFSFPGGGGVIRLGPEGKRIVTFHHSLYKGPVEDFVLVASLVEHDDFADVENASKRIADKVSDAAATALGALVGIPAEAVAEETWFEDGIASGLGLVMDGIFGMGDDPYDSQVMSIRWEELGDWGPTVQPPYKRADDPKIISPWTHKLTVTGHDDGGDLGSYSFYFFVDVTVKVRLVDEGEIP